MPTMIPGALAVTVASSFIGRRPDKNMAMDRRLAQKNIRTALIAGAICVVIFGASFLAAAVY
jgi:hypothetical protein